MNDLVDIILQLSQDIKVLKAYMEYYRKSRMQQFKESWVTGKDIMDMLGISKRKLQSSRDNKTLPFAKLDGKFYYKMSDLEKLLDKHYANHQQSGRDNE